MLPPSPSLFSSPYDYRAQLVASGWQEIGRGAGGTVHHFSSAPFVVKVSVGDAAYLEFIKYAIANPGPCLPCATIIHEVQSAGVDWAVTHIEYLTPLSSAAASAVIAWWDAFKIAKKTNGSLPAPSSWSTLFERLQKVANSINACYDVKINNVMLRGHDVVFTDPLF